MQCDVYTRKELYAKFRLPWTGEAYVDNNIRYTQEISRWFEENLGSEVVSCNILRYTNSFVSHDAVPAQHELLLIHAKPLLCDRWIHQAILAISLDDVVLSSSTTCSKRISSMCRGSSLHGAVYSFSPSVVMVLVCSLSNVNLSAQPLRASRLRWTSPFHLTGNFNILTLDHIPRRQKFGFRHWPSVLRDVVFLHGSGAGTACFVVEFC